MLLCWIQYVVHYNNLKMIIIKLNRKLFCHERLIILSWNSQRSHEKYFNMLNAINGLHTSYSVKEKGSNGEEFMRVLESLTNDDLHQIFHKSPIKCHDLHSWKWVIIFRIFKQKSHFRFWLGKKEAKNLNITISCNFNRFDKKYIFKTFLNYY